MDIQKVTYRLPIAVRQFALLLLFLASGMVFAQGKEIAPTATVVGFPEIGTVVEIPPGDTVLIKGQVFTYGGIKLLRAVKGKQRGSGVGRSSITLDPQYLIARSQDNNWTYYTGNVKYQFSGTQDVTGELNSSGLQTRVGGLRMNRTDPDEIEVWVSRHKGQGFVFEEPPEFEKATIGAGDETSQAMELMYVSLANNVLQFSYREHAGTSTKPTLQEPVEFDLSGGSIMEIRGARIEILRADSDGLSYEVLQSFD